MPQYILFHKPYGVLSQFTPEDGARSLAEFDLPQGVYPAGRLDKDSEGLLLLTDDGPLIEQLLNPRYAKPKTYWVLVERVPDAAALARLRAGLRIEDYTTLPCQAQLLDPQPQLPPREPPVRVRKSVQDVWLAITIVEGKNRQVRKMTAAIGHPTLRLVRQSMANLQLGDLAPGQWRAIARSDIAWGATPDSALARTTDTGVTVRFGASRAQPMPGRRGGSSATGRSARPAAPAQAARSGQSAAPAAPSRPPGAWFNAKKPER